jgi:C1A family cysteine protease
MPAVAGRGLGWKKDPPKAPGQTPDRLARGRLGLAPPPPSASCRHLILDILDQGQLSSCVANAGMQALRASQVRQGAVNPPLGSRLWAYYFARAYDHDTENDDGTFLRNFFQAVVKFGFPPESAWPYSDDSGPAGRFREKPPFSLLREAADQSAMMSTPRYERINTEGTERILDVKRAIAAGHVVCFGTEVSLRFTSDDLGRGPILPPIGEQIAGGHALAIAGYDRDGFDVVNSWSESWGDRGWCRFSDAYISWNASDDFWLVDTAPEFSEEVA